MDKRYPLGGHMVFVLEGEAPSVVHLAIIGGDHVELGNWSLFEGFAMKYYLDMLWYMGLVFFIYSFSSLNLILQVRF